MNIERAFAKIRETGIYVVKLNTDSKFYTEAIVPGNISLLATPILDGCRQRHCRKSDCMS